MEKVFGLLGRKNEEEGQAKSYYYALMSVIANQELPAKLKRNWWDHGQESSGLLHEEGVPRYLPKYEN